MYKARVSKNHEEISTSSLFTVDDAPTSSHIFEQWECGFSAARMHSIHMLMGAPNSKGGYFPLKYTTSTANC